MAKARSAAKSKKPKKKLPARRVTKKAAAPRKKKPAPARRKAAAAKKKPATLMPLPDSKQAALDWFRNLSGRIQTAGAQELQALIEEARTYDLVGLDDVFGDHEQVLALNKAANDLIAAAIDIFGAASPEGFQLQVLRDILNDS